MQTQSYALLFAVFILPLGLTTGRAAAAQSEVSPEPVSHRRSAVLAAPERPTGLVIDARGLSLNRAMGPRILDEDGAVLYPDPKNVPEMSVLQDRGMAAYVPDLAGASRSGKEPLVVTALCVAGAGRDDVVVPRDAAAVIRRANARHRFLDRWAVSFLVGGR